MPNEFDRRYATVCRTNLITGPAGGYALIWRVAEADVLNNDCKPAVTAVPLLPGGAWGAARTLGPDDWDFLEFAPPAPVMALIEMADGRTRIDSSLRLKGDIFHDENPNGYS